MLPHPGSGYYLDGTQSNSMWDVVTSAVQPEKRSHGAVGNGDAVLLKAALLTQKEGLLSLAAASILHKGSTVSASPRGLRMS